jgi:RHS repeat-associated protein
VVVVSANFRYDPLDRRIRTNLDSNGVASGGITTTWTAYDGQHAYADFASNGAIQTRYLHGPAVDKLLARTDAGTGQTLWYLKDVRGSTRLVADLALSFDEDLVDAIAYDAYGNVLSETAPSVGGRYKYTGRENDAATGLYDYHNRWYDPKAGVFVEQDPLGFAAGDANLSRYVGNSPTIYVHPYGLRDQYMYGRVDNRPLPGPNSINWKEVDRIVDHGEVFRGRLQAVVSAGGLAKGPVSGRRRPSVFLQPEGTDAGVRRAILAQQFVTVVRRAVVHSEQLPVPETLRQHGPQGPVQEPGAVEDRHDDGNSWPHGVDSCLKHC